MVAPNARRVACSSNNADEKRRRLSRKMDRANLHKTGGIATASGGPCKRSSVRKANKCSFARAGAIRRACAEKPGAIRSGRFLEKGGKARRKTARFPAWFRERVGPGSPCWRERAATRAREAVRCLRQIRSRLGLPWLPRREETQSLRRKFREARFPALPLVPGKKALAGRSTARRRL